MAEGQDSNEQVETPDFSEGWGLGKPEDARTLQEGLDPEHGVGTESRRAGFRLSASREKVLAQVVDGRRL